MYNLFKKSIREYQRGRDLMYELKKCADQIRSKSKKAIALLRRDNIKESQKIIKETENLFKEANKLIKKNKDLANAGFYKEAVEEYIEAKVFYNFLTESTEKIPDFIKAKSEEIISGVCDFTGELVRKAVTLANLDNFKQLIAYQRTIEKITEELTRVGLEGKLRHKYDELERNLRKLEDILYHLRLKDNYRK
jgi:translin